jgi:hypothetical protein
MKKINLPASDDGRSGTLRPVGVQRKRLGGGSTENFVLTERQR